MKWLLGILVFMALLVGIPFVGLNTAPGRHFAESELNKLTAGKLAITGLAGHFPRDLKLATFSVADKNGIWLTGTQAELRWDPIGLLRRNVHITSLTLASLNIARQPVSAGGDTSSGSPPKFHLNVDHVTITALNLAPALAGQAETLSLDGQTHLANTANAALTLNAATPDGQNSYHIQGAITDKTVALQAQIAEQPDGPLGHFAGPQVHDPLAINLALNGPSNAAALNFTAALGNAQLNGAGTLNLNPATPGADVVLSIPALAPYGALAHQNLTGHTSLHLVVQQTGTGANLDLDGDIAIAAAPQNIARLVGNQGHLALHMTLAGQTAQIANLEVQGTAFDAALSGTVARSGVILTTHLMLPNVANFSPRLSGTVTEDGTVTGTAQNFGINGLLTGDVLADGRPSGPFTIAVNAQNLPHNPSGTLTGSGALEGAPLLLDAAFSVTNSGSATIVINNALWRSLDATAHIVLGPGEELPTGTAHFAIGSLKDFAAFSPVPLSGSVNGNFAHQDAQNFTLNLDAHNLLVDPRLGLVNAKLAADGPVAALTVKLTATIAKLLGLPAQLTGAGVVNLPARSANLASFSGHWHGLNAALQGPAGVETKPALVIHHLNATINGGHLAVDGTLSPRLNAKIAVTAMPVRVLSLFAPSIQATGTLAATADITGTAQKPAGSFTLNGQKLHLATGQAATLPPADVTGVGTLTASAAQLKASLSLGTTASLTANGTLALTKTGQNNLHIAGRTDLRLLDPILSAQGSVLRGVITTALTLTGTQNAPNLVGDATLAGGSFQDVAAGFNLTGITAALNATGRTVTLASLHATAGGGTISGHGTADLSSPALPVDFALNADNATPLASDIITENLNAALTLTGAVKTGMVLGGTVTIAKANINIPKSLPPSVANLPIRYPGEKPAPPAPPPPPLNLNLTISAKNQIFVRGDGLFAELGGKLHLTGTAAHPSPEGGFDLIRGQFTLASTNLQFTSGTISFTGDGFMPTLDLEASTVTSNNDTATLVVGGTAAKPTITLTSSPPLPSDEILAQLLFGQSATTLTAFQAASLAAALAQLSGIGGGSSPLDAVRNALGLDQLSLGGSGSGPPSIQAGRYIAPGIYVGATQATNGQGTQATVQVNLYKGLKLQTATGTTGASSGNSSSVGLTYQFNY
jgi:translocation and assembly module TamB